jgi:hypothetical protein
VTTAAATGPRETEPTATGLQLLPDRGAEGPRRKGGERERDEDENNTKKPSAVWSCGR